MTLGGFPAIPVVFWFLFFLFLWKVPLLIEKRDQAESPADPLRVSVIIPSRNEEKNLPTLLSSLAAQSWPPAEVLIVNDNSTDGTARLATAGGARLWNLAGLPEGWTGKAHACWQGALASCGEILVFLDADTVLEEDGLKGLIGAYLQTGGLISVQPYHRMEKPYERLSAFFNLILFLSMNISSPYKWLNRPRGAFGPCLVCGRQDYFSLGGHQAVKSEIIEDMALARLALKRGFPVHCFAGKGLISFRMYPGGLKHLTEGWTKNFATGAGRTEFSLFLVAFGWVAGALTGPLDIIKGLANDNIFLLKTGGILYLMYSVQICYFLKKLGNFGALAAALYPVHLLFFIWIFLRSLVYTHLLGYVYWKGRKISLRKGG